MNMNNRHSVATNFSSNWIFCKLSSTVVMLVIEPASVHARRHNSVRCERFFLRLLMTVSEISLTYSRGFISRDKRPFLIEIVCNSM